MPPMTKIESRLSVKVCENGCPLTPCVSMPTSSEEHGTRQANWLVGNIQCQFSLGLDFYAQRFDPMLVLVGVVQVCPTGWTSVSAGNGGKQTDW